MFQQKVSFGDICSVHISQNRFSNVGIPVLWQAEMWIESNRFHNFEIGFLNKVHVHY